MSNVECSGMKTQVFSSYPVMVLQVLGAQPNLITIGMYLYTQGENEEFMYYFSDLMIQVTFLMLMQLQEQEYKSNFHTWQDKEKEY
jgi:hypothetical protein